MNPLIPAADSWTLWAVIASGTAVSIWLESRYRWAARLSAPVLALLLAMLLSNTGVMPVSAPAYDVIGDWLVPLALPLLLMQAHVVRIARDTGRLFIALHVCALGTIIGGVIAVWALRGIGVPELDQAAAIMTGSYIGGMVNFLALADSTQASGTLVSSLIVADNLVMAGCFLILLWIAGNRFFLRHFPHPHTGDDTAHRSRDPQEVPATLSVQGLAVALAFSFAMVAVAMGLGRLMAGWFPPEVAAGSWLGFLRTLATNKFVLITGVSLAAATAFPRWLHQLHGYERVGFYLLYLFLFSIGLPADLHLVLVQSPILFVLCTIMAVANIVTGLALGKLLRLDLEEILIGVNATMGGPPTAAAMAVSRGWTRLILPGLLAGLWGYVIGTPLGLLVHTLVAPR